MYSRSENVPPRKEKKKYSDLKRHGIIASKRSSYLAVLSEQVGIPVLKQRPVDWSVRSHKMAGTISLPQNWIE